MGSYYKASKSKTQNRKSWSITFRHPLRRDSKGKKGLKVRRGLGTADQFEADRLVLEMNELLSNEFYWSPGVKQKALLHFDERIVSAFYDSIEPKKQIDSWEIRENIIPIPNKAEGYSMVQLLGTTGAGKTTLIRQLIGTHPEKDRFPSTSTAKTTVCDMEIILKDQPLYSSVVTFFPLERIRLYIEECVLNAGKSHVDGENEQSVIRHLLEHTEQRFRLSYILGNLTTKRSFLSDFFNEEDCEEETIETDNQNVISSIERAEMEATLRKILSKIQSSSSEVWSKVHLELGLTIGHVEEKDEEAVEALFEDVWKESSEFNEIIDEILEEVEKRFGYVTEGEWNFNSQDWPESWTFVCDDRSHFINVIKQMTSNYAMQFGRLLTPLVQGVRIIGPFKPIWCEGDIPKLVLIDGEGLGHQAGSSLSTKISKRIETVDAVLLVDNSKSPMLTEPISILKHLATSGQSSKLHVCFTHFDEVKGDNLLTLSDKRNHVYGSLENALNEIANVLGSNISRHMSRQLRGRVYFAEGIHKFIEANNDYKGKQLTKLVEALLKPKEEFQSNESFPIYEATSVILSIQSAAKEFYKNWDGRLGFLNDTSLKEHWTRIKALTRRLAELGEDEYDNLKPIAELIMNIRENIFKSVLDNPIEWSNPNTNEEAKQEIVDKIAVEFNKNLHAYISEKMWDDHIFDWMTAYGRNGSGSSYLRANDIKEIYKETLPLPDSFESQKEAVYRIYDILKSAINECGGRI